VLSSGDFWASMWHSVLFTLLSTPLLVLLPL
jgi:multiple sugar transport system permease protein